MVKKHMLDVDNELWRRVSVFKAENGLKVNEAVVELIKRGLDGSS